MTETKNMKANIISRSVEISEKFSKQLAQIKGNGEWDFLSMEIFQENTKDPELTRIVVIDAKNEALEVVVENGKQRF